MKRKQWKRFLTCAGAAALLTCGGCSRTAGISPSDTKPEESQTEASVSGTEAETGTNIDESAGETVGETVFSPTVPESSSGEQILEKPNGESDDGGQEEEVSYQIIENIILATDIHYFDPSLTDYGTRFQEMVEYGDGKVVTYIDEITDAFLEEVIQLRPNALILSGDLTLEGEKKSHESLAEKLYRVEEAGIPVLVIPGNHDINNKRAARYEGEQRLPAEYTTPEEFRRIYRDFGYDEAISEDVRSLSYVYQLDEEHRIMMLDTCQYRPVAKVGGAILSETYYWIEEQLEEAWDEAMDVIPVAHHNLLEESKIYVDDCTIEHGEQLVDILDEWDVKLFLSGHLHVQRIRKHKAEPGAADDSYGIMEIVTDALSIPPCQYALLEWKRDGSMEYSTKAVDVSAWAARTGSQNPDLLDFEGWSELYIQKLIIDQIRGVVKNLGNDVEHSMAEVYASVYIDYYAGRRIDAKGIRSSKGYRWWERNMPDSYLLKELDAMIDDSDRDNNYMLLPEVNAAAEE